MNILFWDIETLPGLTYFWQAKTEYIGAHMVIHQPFMLSWAAKWAGQKKVMGSILTPAEIARRDDSRVAEEMASLLRQADYAVAHNGDKFDVPQLNSRVTVNKLQPIGLVQTIDTLKLAKRSLRQTHNTLDSLADALGVARKLKTDWDLWEQCYNGDEVALRRMLRYGKQDVVVLEQVYDALRPHAKGLPRLVDADFAGEIACDKCGSDAIHKDGFYRTSINTFQRYRCTSCGNCMRDAKAMKDKQLGLRPRPMTA